MRNLIPRLADDDEEPIPNPQMNPNINLNVPALPLPSQIYDPPYSRQHQHPPLPRLAPIQASTPAPAAPIFQPACVTLLPAIRIVSTPASSKTKSLPHTRNPPLSKPPWDEKLHLQVRAYESAFKVQLTVLDWDKLSNNDHVGDAGFKLADLLADAPQRDENTGLYGEEADGGHGMKEFKVLLSSSGKGTVPWGAKHNPVITLW
jgi:hypothetical protein